MGPGLLYSAAPMEVGGREPGIAMVGVPTQAEAEEDDDEEDVEGARGERGSTTDAAKDEEGV